MTHKAGTELDRRPPPGKQWHDLVKQGVCRVCEIPLYGWTPVAREVCGNDHCQAEAKRKHPCKFPRLRNSRAAP
ncbi:MAG: hypothetical protein OEU09_23210 [Rhodospirillales bacterium]|nr:hypothetical protein [Rhodospirillales bacterium]